MKTTDKKINVSKVLGYIILIPPLISVVLFVMELIEVDNGILNTFRFTSWTGDYFLNQVQTEGGGGYTSALPFYFGLMAIAGAYLIKDKN
jgi:hypothetical protein